MRRVRRGRRQRDFRRLRMRRYFWLRSRTSRSLNGGRNWFRRRPSLHPQPLPPIPPSRGNSPLDLRFSRRLPLTLPSPLFFAGADRLVGYQSIHLLTQRLHHQTQSNINRNPRPHHSPLLQPPRNIPRRRRFLRKNPPLHHLRRRQQQRIHSQNVPLGIPRFAYHGTRG